MSFTKAYIGTAVPFLLIDALWIGFFVGPYYRETVGHLMLESPNFVAAGLFYLGYVAGVVMLGVLPALAANRLKTALISGGVVGAVAYGTFALTNLSVLQGWTAGMVVSDIAWGTFLTGLSAGCGFLFARRKP
ncbi:MAG: DUF2177 family protein [Woeseiaceae bacterium]